MDLSRKMTCLILIAALLCACACPKAKPVTAAPPGFGVDGATWDESQWTDGTEQDGGTR